MTFRLGTRTRDRALTEMVSRILGLKIGPWVLPFSAYLSLEDKIDARQYPTKKNGEIYL